MLWGSVWGSACDAGRVRSVIPLPGLTLKKLRSGKVRGLSKATLQYRQED